MATDNIEKVPVTIITGFLGAGKTTLLNYLLQQAAEHKNVAVIENEFGEVNIDSNLVSDNLVEREDLVSLDNGCVCCSLRKDIVKALAELDTRNRSRGRKLDGILLETTGLADPAPVAFTFFANPWMAQRFRLDSILCVVDVRHVLQHLVDEKPEGCVNEVVQQLAFSDVLLLNKTDLVTAEELQNVRKVIRAVNNTASIIECQLNRPEGRPTLDKLIDTSSFSVSRALQEVDPAFLDSDTEEDSDDEAKGGKDKQAAAAAAQATAPSTAAAAADSTALPSPTSAAATTSTSTDQQDRAAMPPPSRRRPRPLDLDQQHLAAGMLPHNSREVEAAIAAARAAMPAGRLPASDLIRNPKRRRKHMHDLSGVGSVGLTARGMLDEYRFNMFMRDLLAEKAQQIYRCKGVLAVHGYGTRKFVFQGVHETIVYGPADKPWREEEVPVNQLVFIGKDLNRRELLEGLRTCVWVPLPEGWAEYRDAVTKQPYYYNRDTQEKTWTRPQYACAHVTATKLVYHEQPKGRQPKRQASGLLAVAAVQQAAQAAQAAKAAKALQQAELQQAEQNHSQQQQQPLASAVAAS